MWTRDPSPSGRVHHITFVPFDLAFGRNYMKRDGAVWYAASVLLFCLVVRVSKLPTKEDFLS